MSNRFFIPAAITLSVAAAVSCGTKDPLAESFTNPPSEVRVIVGLGNPSTPTASSDLKADLQRKFDQGYGGVYFEPIRDNYFTPEWFDAYREALSYSKQKGKKLVMYDDIEFPSGVAGDRIVNEFPEHRVRLLVKKEWDVRGPGKFNSRIGLEGDVLGVVAMNMNTKERVLIADSPKEDSMSWDIPAGNWKVMAFSVVQRGRMIDLMDDAAVDKYLELVYEKYDEEFGEFFGNTITENFFDDVGLWYCTNPWNRSVSELIRTKYGLDPLLDLPAMWYDVGEDTQAIRACFFDAQAQRLGDTFARKLSEFAAEHGYKCMGHVPGAYEPNPTLMSGDPFKFYKYLQMPFQDILFSYMSGRPGIKVTSSAATINDHPASGAEMYAGYHLDGDMLYRVPMESMTRDVNFIVSFAHNYANGESDGFDGTSYRETHPATEFSYTKEWNDFMGRSYAMLQGGRSVVDIAVLVPMESLHATECFEEDVLEIEENNKKMTAMMPQGMAGMGMSSIVAVGGGQRKANTDYSMFMGDGMMDPSPYVSIPTERTSGNGKHVYESCNYFKISELLSNQVRHDFTFVPGEDLASEKFQVKEGCIHLDNSITFQDYKVVIVPSQFLANVDALAKIREFYDKGGKVLFTREVALKSSVVGKNAEVRALMEGILGTDAQPVGKIVRENGNGGVAMYIPEVTAQTLREALEVLLPAPDVDITPLPQLEHEDTGDVVFGVDYSETSSLFAAFGAQMKVLPDNLKGELSYVHKVKDGRNIYCFINTSDHPLNTTVRLRGNLELESWNPHNGQMTDWGSSPASISGEEYTEITLALEPVSAVFAVEKL